MSKKIIIGIVLFSIVAISGIILLQNKIGEEIKLEGYINYSYQRKENVDTGYYSLSLKGSKNAVVYFSNATEIVDLSGTAVKPSDLQAGNLLTVIGKIGMSLPGSKGLSVDANRIIIKGIKPISVQTLNKIKTINWKTYSNKEFGFEVEHPRDYKIQEVSAPKDNYLRLTFQRDNGVIDLYITIEKMKYQNLNELVNSFSINNMPIKLNPIKFSGNNIEGIKIKSTKNDGNCIDNVAFTDNQRLWIFSNGDACSYDDDIFNTIVASFNIIR